MALMTACNKRSLVEGIVKAWSEHEVPPAEDLFDDPTHGDERDAYRTFAGKRFDEITFYGPGDVPGSFLFMKELGKNYYTASVILSLLGEVEELGSASVVLKRGMLTVFDAFEGPFKLRPAQYTHSQQLAAARAILCMAISVEANRSLTELVDAANTVIGWLHTLPTCDQRRKNLSGLALRYEQLIGS